MVYSDTEKLKYYISFITVKGRHGKLMLYLKMLQLVWDNTINNLLYNQQRRHYFLNQQLIYEQHN